MVNFSETCLSGEEVVISGIAGMFPSSENIQQFIDNLYNKVDMIQSPESNWNFNYLEVPKCIGKVKTMQYFDASFFRIPRTMGAALEAMSGKVLEQTYAAIFDAGVNPKTLAGKYVGVYVGSSYGDIFALNFSDLSQTTKYVIAGSSKSMIANRVSYWLDLKSPSLNVDASCCSSTASLTMAYRSIKEGYSEAAIVAGCNHSQHPFLSANLSKAGHLCIDGKTKCFDKKGDGYVRSEAISIFFLQKAKHAKRIYAEIYYADEKFFAKPDDLFLPARNADDIEMFLKECYKKAKLPPRDVEYVEANGAGLVDADAAELEAIGRVFSDNKTVLVGCVKSNMGHAEPAAGLCSLTKICVAYHKGQIAGNIYYDEPIDIPAVKKGKIQVLTENTPFNRSFTALNSFSYTGLNYHVLLKGHFIAKEKMKYSTSIPRIVLVSGRMEHCVELITNLLKNSPVDPEQIALLHDNFDTNITSHLARGYIILDTNNKNETKCLAENIDHFPDVKRPVCFLYSGMGSQWAEMGADLMRIPIFSASIKRCHKVLRPKGMDLIDLITNPDESKLNILKSIVGIIAVQIGLTDILTELGIVPDYIVGHSLGEVACAYADGSLSLEETILSAYCRGLVSHETKFIPGIMAAVKLGHKEVTAICRPEIEAACRNSSQSTTISGPEDIVRSFVKEVTGRGIFAKEVPTFNIAFHSKYIAHAGPKLLSEMNEVIKTPKMRSNKWISSSVSSESWESEAAKFASPEYFTNNLLNQVYFDEATKMIPDNAIIIEIAPHGLMQAIVKKSLEKNIHVPLTKRRHEKPVKYFLEAIGNIEHEFEKRKFPFPPLIEINWFNARKGTPSDSTGASEVQPKLYQAGLNPCVSKLYPKVKYPVSTETPLLSHFVSWEHSEEWSHSVYKKDVLISMASRQIVFSLHDDEWKYLEGNLRNGRNVFPESVYLVLVWETLAMYKDIDYKTMSVTFENVKFHQELEINRDETKTLDIAIHKGSNNFEISCADTLIVSGLIQNDKVEKTESVNNPIINDGNVMNKKDIYGLLNRKGYVYKNNFQLIEELGPNIATLKWTGGYDTFIDAIMQLHLLVRKYDGVSVPKFIRKLSINVDELHKNKHYYTVNIDNWVYSIWGAGIYMEHVIFEDKSNVVQLLDAIFSKINGHKNVKVSYVGMPRNTYQNEVNSIHFGNETILVDFSGYDNDGRRVMGLLSYGSIDNVPEGTSDLLWPVPQDWTLEEAATFILPYVLAYYCLMVKGKLNDKSDLLLNINIKRQKKNVLVTNGDDVFGQAAIAVALAANCKVYTTVSLVKKKQLVMKLFPQLQDNNVILTTDEQFDNILLYNTEKELCDIVINSESGIMREHAMKCVTLGGYFLDTSKHDIKHNSDFGMIYLDGDKHYTAVHLPYLLREENFKERQTILKMMTEDIANGVIKPFSRKVFRADEVKTVTQRIISCPQVERVIFDTNNLKTAAYGDFVKGTNYKNEDVIVELEDFDTLIKSNRKGNRRVISGIDAFFSYIDTNEWAATNPLAHMPTLYDKIFLQGKPEISPDDTFLFMIPGFEGHNRVFKHICERLKIQAFTMQLSPDMSENNFSDIANFMFSHIKKIFHLKTKFYLFGYSFGVNVALELAALIEKEGHTGVIICLDSSPDILSSQIQAYLGNLTDIELQDVIIKHMFTLISGKKSDELKEYLKSTENWTEKLEMCVNALKRVSTHSHEYVKLILNSAYKRMLLPKYYMPNIKLRSEIVLIKGLPHPKVKIPAEDYCLSKYTEKPVKIFHIESDHASAPEDCRISSIVNNLLDPKIIEVLKNTNQCVKYKDSK